MVAASQFSLLSRDVLGQLYSQKSESGHPPVLLDHPAHQDTLPPEVITLDISLIGPLVIGVPSGFLVVRRFSLIQHCDPICTVL